MQQYKEGKNLISQLNPREKAIFLIVDSSGMTIYDIINLTFGDFVKSIGHYIDDSICLFDIYEIGNLLYLHDNMVGIWEIEDFTISISSHESIIAILDYLESKRDECIPFEEPLFQCDDGGKLSKYHLISLFKAIEKFSNAEGDTE